MSEKPHIDIEYTARLARIALSDEEKSRMTSQLDSILGYIEKLNELDTSDVEPTAHPRPFYNVWQEDVAKSDFTTEQALQNAPETRHNMIVVPKIVE